MIFQPELETLPRPELERLQLERLRKGFGVGRLEDLAGASHARRQDALDAVRFGRRL